MKKSILYIFFIFITLQIISAFTFSPIVKDFESSGNGRIQTFRIKNESDDPIAVQINMLTRNMSSIGEEINRDASDLFVAYPHQLILQPDDSQSIRVQWNGPDNLEKEEAFRIVAEQLPISFNNENTNKGQLNIVYKYVGSVYVLPSDLYSDLELESITAYADRLTVRIKNNGISHTIIEDVKLTLNDGTNSVSLGYDDLPDLAGENILAGVYRDFSIIRPSQLSGEDISGELSYTETR